MSQQVEIGKDSENVPYPTTQAEEAVPITVTDEDNIRIRKKTDKVILALLTWIYFLQVLDKAVLGTGAAFNLQKDARLSGRQYSMVGSIAPIAQLAWQPFSSWLIVKVPHRILMPTLVLGWGIAESCLAACDDYAGLLACRFFLGLFEAGCLPLFSIMTRQWYRRAEQPLRVAIWYSTNGAAGIVASALSYGLGHIHSPLLYPWQIIFLFCGLATVITAPFTYWKLDNDVTSARFLTERERIQAAHRLQSDQTGVTHEFKWSQVKETFIDPKTWIWVILGILPNLGSALPSIFGPLVLKGFGFSSYETMLLNIPYGAVQGIAILASCWIAHMMKLRGVLGLFLFTFMLPMIAGCAVLVGLRRVPSHRPALTAAYYLTAFVYSANSLLIAWIIGNTGGATKLSATLALFQAGLSAGDMIGPLLFSSNQAPQYIPGSAGVLGVMAAMLLVVLVQIANLVFLNKRQSKTRVRNGKSATIVDSSVKQHIDEDVKTDQVLGDVIFQDMTDWENDEFMYIY